MIAPLNLAALPALADNHEVACGPPAELPGCNLMDIRWTLMLVSDRCFAVWFKAEIWRAEAHTVADRGLFVFYSL